MDRRYWAVRAMMLAAFINGAAMGGGAWAAKQDDEIGIVLPERIDGMARYDMVRKYLLDQLNEAWKRWQDRYETVKTPEQITDYQNMLRGRFIEMIGGLPERTPLNPQITGVLERDGYRVEKVIFESLPKFYVSAALFLPASDQFKPPYPGILVPCGHAENAKAHLEYQTMGALLALNGMAALVFDPIEQGERMQLLDDNGKQVMWGTKAHTLVGAVCILMGRNTARFEIWDGLRGIDYLQSRPEVDPERIGCTGNSGGGTQTSYMMCLDDRIMAAAPSCYLNRVGRQLETATGDAEQNIYGQAVWGMDHADFLMMRAPVPILICGATEDFFDIRATWETFRYAKRMYTRMGFAERVSLLENDAEHNYNRTQREGVVRWMARWLLHRDEPITEPEITPFKDEELWCTPRGQVMLLEGARSVYDLNADYAAELAVARGRLWQEEDHGKLLARVREITGIRTLSELPSPEVKAMGKINRQGYNVEKLILKAETGIFLPGLLFMPARPASKYAVLYVNEAGMKKGATPGGKLDAWAKDRIPVLAVDVRGLGETQQISQKQYGPTVGLDWEDYFAAYVLGRSYVGMRAEDILTAGRYLAERTGLPVRMVAVGNVGVPALHAAALEPAQFEAITLRRTLFSWDSVVDARPGYNQLINAVHGALQVYDLPDLAKTLGNKVIIEEPMDAMNRPVASGKP